MRKLDKLLIILSILSILLWFLFSSSPGLTERWYGHGIYPVVRFLQGLVFGYQPIPLFLFIWVILLAGLIYVFVRTILALVRRRDILKQAGALLRYMIVLIILFYWLWGFNYYRTPFLERADLKWSGVDAEQLFTELDDAIDKVNGLRAQFPAPEESLLKEDILFKSVKDVLRDYDYTVNGHVAVRRIKPRGSMLRWSTAGMYMPYSGEANMDAGLHPIQVPYVMAHELTHVYGVTDEGVSNFLALLACAKSGDPWISYSAWLGYYRYVARAARRRDKDRYLAARSGLDQQVKDDLTAIYQNSMLYPDWFPEMREAVYDSYLKTHGVKAGTLSYNQLIVLKVAHDHKMKEAGLSETDSDSG